MPKSQLLELYVHGLGVIDDAHLEFEPGFNVLTGETGAGKTLLLGALDLCLGGDAVSSRHAINGDLRVAAIFSRADGHESVLSRESGTSRRLRSSLDGVPSSTEVLRSLADELVVIHGQHDSLALRSRAQVLRIIDSRGGVSTSELDDVRRRLIECRRLRDGGGGDIARRQRDLEFLDFQIAEIERAAIVGPSELDEHLEVLARLSEMRDGRAAATSVINRLDADDDHAVLAQLAGAIDQLPRTIVYEAARTTLIGALESAREGVRELTDISEVESSDEREIERLEERIGQLRALSRKYGGSLRSTLESLEELRAERQVLADSAHRLAVLDEEIIRLGSLEELLAGEARRERESTAAALSEAVQGQMNRVALGGASLRFVVGGDDGSEALILFTPNPGLPEGPLQSLASGGELSRVLLAISLETAHEDVVAVFDEVDAGLGGQVAQQIGECLRELGERQQVLAVTHLASVAARAHCHFVVEKNVSNGTTTASVRRVDGEERVLEIARMLAGDEMTSQALALARKLLETSS